MSAEPEAKCIHLRAATIASDARVFATDGHQARGDVRWCTECGAILALVSGVATRWMRPGDAYVQQAFAAMLEREAAAAEHGGKARNVS